MNKRSKVKADRIYKELTSQLDVILNSMLPFIQSLKEKLRMYRN
ncbi:MAG: hypothetical protein AB8Y22_03450 [Coxiella-like endosymbiont]